MFCCRVTGDLILQSLTRTNCVPRISKRLSYDPIWKLFILSASQLVLSAHVGMSPTKGGWVGGIGFKADPGHRRDSFLYPQYLLIPWMEFQQSIWTSFIADKILLAFTLLSPRTTKLWRGYRVCPVRMYVSTYVRTYVRSYVHPL